MASPVPAGPGTFANGVTIVPSDTLVLSPTPTSLYIGSTGSLTVVMAGNGAVIPIAAAAVGYHPLNVKQVKATGTGAGDIIGYW
jgi:hypothetical protein